MKAKYINKQVEGEFTSFDLIIFDQNNVEHLRLIGFNIFGEILIEELKEKARIIANDNLQIEELEEIIIEN